MVNDQLLNYIQQAKQAGIDDAKISEDLLKNGWTDLDIKEAMIHSAGLLAGAVADKPKLKFKLWLKIILVVVGLFFIFVGIVGVRYYMQQMAIANLDKNGSAEYKQYVESINKINEQLSVIEAEMKANGSSSQDIELAKKDYLDFMGSTILLKIQFESSLSDIEKTAVFKKLVELGIKNKSTLTQDSSIISGGVSIQGTEVPKEVIEINAPKKTTSFPDTISNFDAISKKTNFMRRVMLAIGDGKIVNFTNKELIDNDLGKDLYTYQNGEVINNFGGKVSIKKDEDNVSVIFEKIPKGEDCYRFYYINDPEIYGFEESYIDGVLERYDFTGSKDYNSIIETFKQKVCYSEKETVTIEFRGKLKDIKQEAD